MIKQAELEYCYAQGAQAAFEKLGEFINETGVPVVVDGGHGVSRIHYPSNWSEAKRSAWIEERHDRINNTNNIFRTLKHALLFQNYSSSEDAAIADRQLKEMTAKSIKDAILSGKYSPEQFPEQFPAPASASASASASANSDLIRNAAIAGGVVGTGYGAYTGEGLRNKALRALGFGVGGATLGAAGAYGINRITHT